MVHESYQTLIEMTSNIIYIVAFGVGFKCLHKIHLNTQWGGADYAHHVTTRIPEGLRIFKLSYGPAQIETTL